MRLTLRYATPDKAKNFQNTHLITQVLKMYIDSCKIQHDLDKMDISWNMQQ